MSARDPHPQSELGRRDDARGTAAAPRSVTDEAARVRALLTRWEDDDANGILGYPEGAVLADYLAELLRDALPALLRVVPGAPGDRPSADVGR